MRNLLSALAAGVFAFACLPANAADPLVIRLSDHFPATHFIPETLTRVWMNRVTEITNGNVTFQYFPAEQLVKQRDALPALQRRVIDVALVNPGIFPTEFPLMGVTFLPGGYDSVTHGGAALQKFLQNDAVKAEFDAAGCLPLVSVPIASYEIFANRPIAAVSDVAGMRIRGVGDGQVAALSALGAVPVAMAVNEVYTAIQRGALEGMLAPYGSVKSYHFDEVARNATRGASMAYGNLYYCTSQAFWDGLDPSYRDALNQATSEVWPEFLRVSDEADNELVGAFRDAGVQILDIGADPAQREQWNAALRPVSEAWAAQVDGTGLPGTAVLEAWQAALAETR